MSADRHGRTRGPAAAVAAAVLALSLGLGAFAQSPAGQQPVFRGGTDLVLVDAYPRRKGRVVEGLTAGDFQIFEDGRPRPIQQFEFVRTGPAIADRPEVSAAQGMVDASEPKSRLFVLYLDEYHVTARAAESLHAPLVDLLDQVMSADDLFAIVTSRRPTDLRFSRAALSIVGRFGGIGAWGLGDGPLPDREQPMESDIATCPGVLPAVADGLIRRLREDRAMIGLEQLAGAIGRLRQPRTFVLVASGGWSLGAPDQTLMARLDTASASTPAIGLLAGTLRTSTASGAPPAPCLSEARTAASDDLQKRFKELLDRARASNVTFYPVSTAAGGAGAMLGTAGPAASAIDTMITLAHETDGEAFVRPDQLAEGLAGIGPDISAYYLLGYRSTDDRNDGQAHTIRVRVTRPGVEVASRRAFVAPSAEDVAATAALNAPPPAAPEAIASALDRLDRDTPDTTLLADATLRGNGPDFVVSVQIPRRFEAAGQWTRGAQVDVSVADEHGHPAGAARAVIGPGERSTEALVHPDGDAELWRIDVRVTGPDGELATAVRLRPGRDSLLGEPLLYRLTPAVAAGAVPVLDGNVSRTDRLRAVWTLAESAGRCTGRVLDLRNQPVPIPVSVSVDRVAGGPAVTANVTLAPLPAGDYVLEVSCGFASGDGQSDVAFRVGG